MISFKSKYSWSIEEICKNVGFSRQTFEAHWRKHKWFPKPYFKSGNLVLYRGTKIEEFVERIEKHGGV
ncbi:unnamed protein product [Fructobacillus fructosus]|uniref:helix-turn-helix transcriptional regulator n=1 Tax=Fructobacillus fructosus TaxID=1631 RepID=UPI002D8DE989|nr:unnamed protein product [Fructobacillus fructosus]